MPIHERPTIRANVVWCRGLPVSQHQFAQLDQDKSQILEVDRHVYSPINDIYSLPRLFQ
jgi:hypothetical protein